MRGRWWAVLCVAGALALVFAGCGCGDDDDDSGGSGDQTDDDTADDDTDDDAGDDDSGDDDTWPPLPDDDTDDLPDTITFPAGDLSVVVTTNPYHLSILGVHGWTLLSSTPQPDERAINLSPMPFVPQGFQCKDFGAKWFYAERVTAYAQTDTTLTLELLALDVQTRTQTATITLTFSVEAARHLKFTTLAAGVDEITYQSGAWVLDSDEHFFGLGQQRDSIDSRGKIRTMFLGLGVDLTDQVQNHAPIPFYISSRGYGVFVEDKGHGYFDMGYGRPDAFGWKFRTPELVTHLFFGPHPFDIIDQYTALTGRPPMNPDYLFGYLHWRNENHNEAEVYDDADELRAHGIPASSIMVDAPWQRSYSTFEFTECPGCQFEDAQSMIDYVHDMGYAFYLWTAEFVNRVSPVEEPGMEADNSAQFDYAKSQGYLMSILGLVYEIPWWHGDGAIVNLLNPDAYAWYQDQARNVMEMGAQGFKMDGGEYPGADTIGLWPSGVIRTGGFGDPNTNQYEFKWAYHQLFWELAHEYNGDNAISTVRCAVWGEQSHINYFWPGDLESDWNTELGLPADIIGGLNIGASGFPYYGSNNGGFSGYGAGEDEELFARWTEASAFRPVFEGPRGGTQEVWEVNSPWVYEMYKKYTVLHTRLFPYLKATARKAVETGVPIMRMLPMVFPTDTNTYDRDFDYMLGGALLVEPVYLQGATTRDVYLPEGRWVNYWTNEITYGPTSFVQDAAVADIPVWVRAGAIIPMLDPAVQTLWPTDNPEIVDQTDMDDVMWVDLYPSGGKEFHLGDGTWFEMRTVGAGTDVYVWGPLARTYSLRVVTALIGDAPFTVSGPSGNLEEKASYEDWDASTSGWFFDAATGNLWIRAKTAHGYFTVYSS